MDNKLISKLTNEYIQCPICKKEENIKANIVDEDYLIISCSCGWCSVFNECGEEIYHTYIDKVGGVHSDGLGWNPFKMFCGECTRETCQGCKHRFNTNKD